jgi:hypothetical protein
MDLRPDHTDVGILVITNEVGDAQAGHRQKNYPDRRHLRGNHVISDCVLHQLSIALGVQ